MSNLRPGVDNFKFDLVSNCNGYVSSREKTNLDKSFLIRGSKNCYKKISGNVASRPGLKRRGVANDAAQGIKSDYVWYTSLGTVRPMRIVGESTAGGDAKLQAESSIVDGTTPMWYDLMTNLSLTRFVFDSWWDNSIKKDKVLFVKGDTNMHSWSGGIGKVASTTVNTIVLSADAAQQGFIAAGNVLVNGNPYAYTGISSSTLTGVTPDPSAEAADSVVLQTVVTNANTPAATFTNDFLKVAGNQVYVGSYTSRLIYISDVADFTDYVVPTPRIPGSPELLTLDNTGNGIAIRNGKVAISAGLSDWYFVSFSQITVGTTLTEQTIVDKQKVANLSAALAHEFIDTVGDNIIYLAKDNQLRELGSFRNITTDKYPSLSQSVQTEFENEDFTGGHLKAIGDIIYITAPISGRDWMHQTRESLDVNGNIVAERIWQPPQLRNVSRFCVIDGVVFGHSIANPQIYQIWDTDQWHDDSPSNEPLPYDCVMTMSYRNNDRLGNLSSFDKVYAEGYLSPGINLYMNVYMDYQGSSGLQNLTLSSAADVATLFVNLNAPSLGGSSLGDNPLGVGLVTDPTDQELLPKFRSSPGVNPQNCFEYCLEVYSVDLDSRWEIERLGVNPTPTITGQQPVFIRK
jgi:hypothetical protein